MHETIRRELRVAFSPRAQPLWFRVAKWAVFLSIAAILSRSERLWYWLLGAPLAGVLLHLIYRWKTSGWTRAWGGWDDVETITAEPGDRRG